MGSIIDGRLEHLSEGLKEAEKQIKRNKK